MTTEYSTYYETRYTNDGSYSKSYVSVEIPFPKTESKKITKFKLCFVFVSPFLLIGIIMVLNFGVKGVLNNVRNDTDSKDFHTTTTPKNVTTEVMSTTEAKTTTTEEKTTTTEAKSTTTEKTTTEAKSTTTEVKSTTTEAKSTTTEAKSTTTEAKSKTEANSTTEISEAANRVEILLNCIVELPKNGRTLEEKFIYEHGDIVTYACNENFTLKGDSVRTCKNGVLSAGLEPVCLAANGL